MQEDQRFQRRTVLVKRSLQLKYAAIVFAAILFTALIVGVGSYFTLIRLIQIENPAMMPLVTQALRMDAVKLTIFLGIMFLVSLFVSHRFAGPVYRFEQSARTVGSGDLTHRVSLRMGDDLGELQDEFNAMAGALQRLVQKDRSLIDHLTARIEENLKKLPDAPSESDLELLREDLKSLRDELRHVTRGFTV